MNRFDKKYKIVFFEFDRDHFSLFIATNHLYRMSDSSFERTHRDVQEGSIAGFIARFIGE
jgi:hypothetical protein